MIPVRYPDPVFRMRDEGGKKQIFCTIRKRWLVLTEEEWVRQNFVQYLVQVLHYPRAYIAAEKELLLNGLRKRFDILVYDGHHAPLMLIECKEPAVPLGENALQQALRYNMTLPVSYIVITNGAHTIAWKKDNEGLQLLQSLPEWEDV